MPPKGWSPSPETRAKLSVAMRRRMADPNWVPPSTRPEVAAKISATKRVHPTVLSPEIRRRIGEKIREHFRTGRMIPPMWHDGAAERQAAKVRGVPKSAEHKAKLSASITLAHREHRTGNWAAARKVSLGERKVWPGLKLLGFNRNVVFPTGTKTRYIPDFTHMRRKIVVEIDGDSHTLAWRMRTDRQREEYISGMGFLIVHFPETFARNSPEEVFAHVRSLFAT